METAIAALRGFNRFYTQLVGALEPRFLDSDLSPVEARVLFEIAQIDRPVAIDLQAALGLDAGYVSRILRRFEAEGLVARERDANDSRRRPIALTEAGRAAFAALDRRQRERVTDMLAPLAPSARTDLVAALGTARVLLDAPRPAFTIRTFRAGDMGMIAARQSILYAETYGWGRGLEIVEGEVTTAFLRNFKPGREQCWVAEVDGVMAGSVFLTDEGEGLSRLRLLYVEPFARGLGIGGALVSGCIGFAREVGYATMILWTQTVLETCAAHVRGGGLSSRRDGDARGVRRARPGREVAPRASARLSTPDGLPPLREVVAAHGLAAKKSLGQNFIFDLNLTQKIARAAGPLAGVRVIEVGPGPGGLTRALLAEGAEVVALERDARCLAALAEVAARHPGRLEVREADALGIDMAVLAGAGQPTRVCANLPYNIATPLLIGWLESEPWPPWFDRLTLMFQREVAERIVATPRERSAYGRLAVLSNWRCTTRILFDVPPQSFVPPPSVTSSVVELVPRATPLPCDARTLSMVTQAAFGQRRKMLRQALRPLGVDPVVLLDAAGIAPTCRAEEVDRDGFVAMANALSRARA